MDRKLIARCVLHGWTHGTVEGNVWNMHPDIKGFPMSVVSDCGKVAFSIAKTSEWKVRDALDNGTTLHLDYE